MWDVIGAALAAAVTLIGAYFAHRQAGRAEFPDSVTQRGAKHLEELGDVAEGGGRAVMLFLVQRGDASTFALARDIDPAYAAGFARARERGVEALAYACEATTASIELARPLPILD